MLMMVSMSVMGQNDYFVTTREQDEQVNEVEPQITEEKQFIMDNFKYINVTDWKRGMRFMVVDDDLSESRRAICTVVTLMAMVWTCKRC